MTDNATEIASLHRRAAALALRADDRAGCPL
jgi:hypothetical protein